MSVYLFIGLLSFQTFVSCTHTRQLVGGNEAGTSRYSDYQYHLIENGSRDGHTSETKDWLDIGIWSVLFIWPWVVGFLVLLNTPLSFSSTKLKNNSSMLTTPGPFNGSISRKHPIQAWGSNSSIGKDHLDEVASTLELANSKFGK